MPFIYPNDAEQSFRTYNQPNIDALHPDEPEKTPFAEGLAASFAIDNEVVSLGRQGYKAIERSHIEQDTTPVTIPVLQTFFDSNEQYWLMGYGEQLQGAETVGQLYEIKQEIDYELKQRDIISRMSGWQQLLASVAAGVASPTTLLPGGALYKSGRLLQSTARTAASVSAYTAGSIGLQELVLQQTQQTRTFNESIANTLTGAAFGGILGGTFAAAYKGGSAYANKVMSEQIQAVLNDKNVKVKLSENGDMQLQVAGGDVGAAVSEESHLNPDFIKSRELVNIPDWIQSRMKHTPVVRMLTSSFGYARKFIDDILVHNFELERHYQGKASDAVEAQVAAWYGRNIEAQKALDDGYNQYLGTDGNILKTSLSELQAKKNGMLSRDDFSVEVFRAGYSGDKSDVVGVEYALSKIRPFMNELKDEAIALGFLPDGIEPQTALSYMMRIYNQEKIQLNRWDVKSPGVSKPFQTIVEDFVREVDQKIRKVRPEYDEINKKIAGSIDEAEIKALTEARDNLIDRDMLTSKGDLREIIGNEKRMGYEIDEEGYNELITLEANRIIGNILGIGSDTLHSRMVHSPVQTGGKPLKERTFMIRDELISDYLYKDMNQVLSAYTRNMAFAVEMGKYAERIGVKEGDSILTHYEKLLKEELEQKLAANPGKSVEINQEFVRVKNEMADVLLGLQGRYGMPDADGMTTARALRMIKMIQVLRYLGSVALYAPIDFVMSTFRYGFKGLMRDGVLPILRSPKITSMRKTEMRDASVALETVSSRLFRSMLDGYESAMDKTKLELLTERVSRGFGNLTFLNQITDFIDTMNAGIVQADIIRKLYKWEKTGKLSKREVADLAQMRIGEQDYAGILAQVKKHSEEYEGSYLMNSHLFDDKVAKNKVQQAMMIMTENMTMRTRFLGDKPLGLLKPWKSFIFLFQNFLFANLNKILLQNGLQRQDLGFIQGVTALMTMGALTYGLRQLSYGREIKEEDLIIEALDNSGLLAIVLDPALRLLKFSGVAGEGFSRYQNRGDWSVFLGPGFALGEDVLGVAGKIINGIRGTENFTEKDVQKTIRLLPFSNIYYLNPIMQYISRPIADVFDLDTIEDMEKNK